MVISVFLLLSLAVLSSQKGITTSCALLFSVAVVAIEFIVNRPGIMSLVSLAVFAFLYSLAYFWLAFRVHNDIPQYAVVLFGGVTGWFFLPIVIASL